MRNVTARTAYAVDPDSGATGGSTPVTNKLAIRGSLSMPQGLLLLLGSSGLHGSTMQVVLVGADGAAQTATLDIGARHGVTHASVLTADAANGHAYIVVAGGVVFDVDLTTLAVTRHVVAPLWARWEKSRYLHHYRALQQAY